MHLPRILPFLLALPALLAADVTLGPLFRDGCVLQHGKPLRIYGQADPGEAVTVTFNDQTVAAATHPGGHWLAVLKPLAPSAEPALLTVSGRNTVVVRDVLVGDVWLCSGQSNMEWQVRRSDRATEEIAAANHPLIRHFKIPHEVASTPQRTVPGEWVSCSPQTVGDFSAVAYYFARELQAKLGIPIGLVNSSWGGTQIESWMSAESLATHPASAAILQRWQERLDGYPAALSTYQSQLATWQAQSNEARAAGRPFTRRRPRAPEGAGSRWEPAGLYNAMVAPLVPASMRGVIWYQGETNAARHDEYRTLFPTMIQHWRRDFAQGDLPFLFVQLANLNRSSDPTGELWAWQRDAQAAALSLPATGMAVTIDIGDPNDIHPTNKQDVGRRLALLALRHAHGQEVVDEGPTLTAAVRNGSEVLLRWRSAAGLRTDDPALPGFELAGPDGTFHAASARIDGDSVVVSHPAISTPNQVRYAWHNNPPSPLRNGAGLPAVPFRTNVQP